MSEESQEKLSNFLRKFELLNQEEIKIYIEAFEEVKIKKRQYIVQPGFTAKHKHYVVKGAFRSFVVGDNGSDHTTSFAIEDWWISDYNSYIYQQPATMFVIALEDSVILKISREKEKHLCDTNHKIESVIRRMAERGLAFQQRRMISNLTQSAEERYDLFMEKYPQVVMRLPQYALASFLGMSTEFLSKIRNKKLKKRT
ncbi:Crp/Fnr family transcriptional regulator [Reichenbachiella versicolor]|uniref:Crp/Fnr family transcriptional regulator n=1 Tax=Reichenbachiella versicolor TaxID=1821036 RepID=UPI000D6DC5C7|nr:Crp/Fnr family transcriptional regulator [Reichenbachiella versicolor]